MAGFLREQVELAAEEEDSDAVVGERSEASGVGFDGLNLAVEAFADGVGDVVRDVGQQSLEMSLEHLRFLGDWFEAAADGPGVWLIAINLQHSWQ